MANACVTSDRTVHGSCMNPFLMHRQSVDTIATLMSRKRRNCKNDNQGLIQSNGLSKYNESIQIKEDKIMKNCKDRIICVSSVFYGKTQVKGKNKYKDSSYSKSVVQGNHTFYYQPVNSAERYYLFSTKRYSPSIAAVFAERGVLMCNGQASQTHSITLGEFYRVKNHHHNFALNKVFERIPVWIDDVIRYEMSDAEVCFSDRCNKVCFADEYRRDDERAA